MSTAAIVTFVSPDRKEKVHVHLTSGGDPASMLPSLNRFFDGLRQFDNAPCAFVGARFDDNALLAARFVLVHLTMYNNRIARNGYTVIPFMASGVRIINSPRNYGAAFQYMVQCHEHSEPTVTGIALDV